MVPEAGQAPVSARQAAPRLWLAGSAARSRFAAARLTAADRRRWSRMVSASHREEWMSSRALLAAQTPAPGAAWSLSHSGGFAALAVVDSGMRIGVDLERVKQRDFRRLAEFGFDARETAALFSLPKRVRARHFYTMWTLKEAAAKALRMDLWRALRRCVFIPGPDGWQGHLPVRVPWRAWVYSPRRGLLLSVVCVGDASRRMRAPRCRDWPPSARHPSSQVQPVRTLKS